MQLTNDEIFLNGVCRHEHEACILAFKAGFLNGVCRHEHLRANTTGFDQFLNGVCRHELNFSFDL